MLPIALTAVRGGVLLSGGVDATLHACEAHPAGALGTAGALALMPLLPARYKVLVGLATLGGWGKCPIQYVVSHTQQYCCFLFACFRPTNVYLPAYAEPQGVSELAKSGMEVVLGKQQQQNND